LTYEQTVEHALPQLVGKVRWPVWSHRNLDKPYLVPFKSHSRHKEKLHSVKKECCS